MIEIDVLVEDDGWSDIDLEAVSKNVAGAMQAELGAQCPQGVAAILFTSDGVVQALNRDFRDKDKPTNVLSFPSDSEGLPPDTQIPLGDIAISYGVTAHEAEEKGVSVLAHVTHLVVHGLLHLTGYDHIVDDEAEEMESLERAILARLNVADPYG